MWDGPPAYTVFQAEPKLVRRQECKGPLSETSGTQINDFLYLHQYPGCLCILYIYYIFIHFTPAFFYLIPAFCILIQVPGPQLILSSVSVCRGTSSEFSGFMGRSCLPGWQYEGHSHLETTCFLIFYGTNVIGIVGC